MKHFLNPAHYLPVVRLFKTIVQGSRVVETHKGDLHEKM